MRFIYVHKKEHYLSIDPVGVGKKRDVIELPIDDLLDMSGWELTKALKLFRKSNPPLLEWLHSPIIYYTAFSTVEQMKELENDVFAPHSCMYHYLNMARKNYREHLQRDQVKLKKYFYALRPVLAAKWIEQFNEFPPLEFLTLLEKMLPEGQVKNEVETLLQRKMAGDELDKEPPNLLINEFLSTEIARLEVYAKTMNLDLPDPTEKLDGLFREALDEVWKG